MYVFFNQTVCGFTQNGAMTREKHFYKYLLTSLFLSNTCAYSCMRENQIHVLADKENEIQFIYLFKFQMEL